jgi:cytoskeletal protein RodZ
MRKNEKKQKKSMLFSSAVVVMGCLLTALYVNQTMEQTTEYKLDLSELDEGSADAGVQEEQELGVLGEETALDQESALTQSGDEETVKASGTDVVNPALGQDESAQKNTGVQSTSDTAETSAELESTDSGTQVSLSFDAGDGMTWPVRGDVILNYSMDSSVYFATLDQYRYNPAILIGAEEGDNVSSCARGRVTEIGECA